MLRKHQKLAVLSLALSTAFSAYASAPEKHVIVAPACLMKNMHGAYTTLSSNNAFSLISVDSTGMDELMQAKTAHSATPCGGFKDVTQAWITFQGKQTTAANPATAFLAHYALPMHRPTPKIDYSIQYQTQVNQVLSGVSSDHLMKNLTLLTHYEDRYANSDNGLAAANWIKHKMEKIAKRYHRDDVTTYVVSTGYWYKQPSVVVKIGNSSEPGIVVGAHMDTTSANYFFGSKPGADDDGSGSVSVLEAARSVLSSGLHFKKPIYFIWYAAEEEGLYGSQAVVADFKEKKIPVDAVIHFDMTGYMYHKEPKMWLLTDDTNPELTAYLAKLITTYVKQPVGYTRCGYACSDHASWTDGNFVAGMATETEFNHMNPNLHSSSDTIEKLSPDHMTDYAKLAIAFAVELAEPTA